MYVRLNRDRTVKLCKRPLLQLGHTPATAGGSGGGGGVGSSGSKAKSSSKASASSRGSATTAEEHAQLKEELTRDRKEREEVFSAFGTWSFQDENPLPTAAVRMELREGRRQERIRYESRCQFGGDGYVAKFKRGTVFRYKGSKEGSDSVVPLGKYAVGTFMLRANAHRPVVTKDFMAFQ